MKEFTIISKSPEETQELAFRIGRTLRGSEIILLKADLGGGKTTFVKGLARGIGSDDNVSSPTFTISKIYKGETLTLHHYDLYRLNELGLMSSEINEVLNDSQSVVVAEWPEIAQGVFEGEEVVVIQLIPDEHEDQTRTLRITIPDDLSYVEKTIRP